MFRKLIFAGWVMLLVVKTLAASVILQWDPNTEPDLKGYRVHIGQTNRVYTETKEAGLATTNAVTNLVAGQSYVFAVTAYNEAGFESDFSDEVVYTVPVVEPLPAPSQFVVARSVFVQGQVAVRLMWDPNSESDLAGYRVQLALSSGVVEQVRDVGLVTRMEWHNLDPGVTYYFTVTAYNTAGLESRPSNEVVYQGP